MTKLQAIKETVENFAQSGIDLPYCKQLISLAEELEAKTQWRPIETAAKDGRSVLLASRGYLTHGYWDGDKHVCSVIGVPSEPFTHWMPLPEPPQPSRR